MLENIPEPALLIVPENSGYTVLKTNSAFQQFFGLDESQDSKQSLEKVLEYFNPVKLDQSREQIFRILEQAILQKTSGQTGILQFQSNQNQNSGNEVSYVQYKCVPFLIIKGDVKQLLLIVDDVTDAVQFGKNIADDPQKTGQPALEEKNENLEIAAAKHRARFEAASKKLDDFVYSVSHDLRAPLRRIDGFSQELIENYLGNLDETGQHYLRRMRQGAQDMGNLIDDLLKLSRISRREVERSSVNISEIARGIFEDLKTEMPERDIELVTTGSLEADADPGLLKIVLTNLLSNAVKFTRNSESATIEVGSTQKDGKKTYFVKDNGIGFDPAYSEKLFKPFQRLHSQHEYDGTGIGLVTVKRIVNSHNGRIWADGTPGEGAVFYFTLR